MIWSDIIALIVKIKVFSNIWFWFFLIVQWFAIEYRLFGIPFSWILEARYKGGQAQDDLERIVHIHAQRFAKRARKIGPAAWAGFYLSSFALLGFVYHLEFAQGLFILLFPVFLLSFVQGKTAQHIIGAQAKGDMLHKILRKLRFFQQGLGAVTLFGAVFWGIYSLVPVLAP